MRKTKLFSILALLLMATSCAWATSWTTLAVGDVIKPGDTFTTTQENYVLRKANSMVTTDLLFCEKDKPYTFRQVNLFNEDPYYEDATNGTNYVFTSDNGMTSHFGSNTFLTTANSDGLVVTAITDFQGYNIFELAVHDVTQTTVTWDKNNVTDIAAFTQEPYTKEGVTLSANADENVALWRIGEDEGIEFNAAPSGGFTFTAPTGKKFAKIEMTLFRISKWDMPLFLGWLGSGWPTSDDVETVSSTMKLTWNGTAASTVGLLTQIEFGGFGGIVESIVFTLVDANSNGVTLTDGEGITALNSWTGKSCAVTYQRAFNAGKASTVCLPFAYAKKAADGSFYAFTNIEKEGNDYVATMTEPGVSTLEANTPYLFMPAATGNVDFSGTYTIPTTLTAGSVTSNGWTFKGTYEAIEWTTAPTGTYGFSAQDANDGISQGQFVKVGAYVKIVPMRCYLENASFAGARSENGTNDEVLPETIKVRLISANGEVTAIGTMQTKTGEVTLDNDAWYSLDGRRVQNPAKGVYIKNGRKVVIK